MAHVHSRRRSLREKTHTVSADPFEKNGGNRYNIPIGKSAGEKTLKMQPRTRQALLDNALWLAWGVLYALSFPTYSLSFAIWFVFAPVFLFAYVRPLHLTVRYAFFYSLPSLFLSFFWIYGFWGPGLAFMVLIYAVYYAFFFFCIALAGKTFPRWRWVLSPSLWIANELIRSIGFHGFMWNMIGDTQWRILPFVQSADILGVWGVSFLILTVNAVLAELVLDFLRTRTIRGALTRSNSVRIAAAAALFTANLVYGWSQLGNYRRISAASPREKLALLQPNIGSHEPWWKDRWRHFATIWRLNAEAAVRDPDLIVWSETMVRNYLWHYLKTMGPDEEVNLFNIRFVKMPFEFNTPILITSPTLVDGRNFNSAEYLDPLTNTIQNNSKIHLVPFGEWMPVYDRIPAFRQIMESEGAGSYTPSTNKNVIRSRRSKFRVLVCYEDMFAVLARKFIRIGVNYFINTTNDGWAYLFGFPHPMWQHLAGAVLTAISVRRPIARAANTGVTGIIDLTGDFQGDIGDYRDGLFVGSVSVIDERIVSPYVHFGFLFPYLLLVVAAGAFGASVVLSLSRKGNSGGRS